MESIEEILEKLEHGGIFIVVKYLDGADKKGRFEKTCLIQFGKETNATLKHIEDTFEAAGRQIAISYKYRNEEGDLS